MDERKRNEWSPADPQLMSKMAADPDVRATADRLFLKSAEYRYSYNFTWLGRPIIQYPEDLLALQEIVWHVKPDLVVETGVAHGGSLVFYASLLAMLGGDGRVVGVDVEVRAHNEKAIREHPLSSRIDLVIGSSISEATVARVREMAEGRRVLVVLDSMHTRDHVLAELRAYSPLVKAGSYLVVLDTVVEKMPKSMFADRPWGPGDNPMTAVDVFMKENKRFILDEEIDNRLLLTVAPRGYLRCVQDP